MQKRPKKISAVVLAIGCTGALAQSSVTVFGVMDIGIEYAKAGAAHKTSEVSSVLAGSRLGFRGTEDLGGGLAAVFRLESGINMDIGAFAQGGLAFGREATVGLSSRIFGTILLGRAPTAYYVNVFAADAFNQSHAGSLLTIQRSSLGGNSYMLPLLANGRLDNSLSYISSTLWDSVVIRLQGALGEGSPAIGRAYDASVRYTRGPLDVAVTLMRQNGANNSNGSARAVQVGGNYNFGAAKVYAGYTREANDCLTCTGILSRIQGLTPTGTGDFRLVNVGVRVPVSQFSIIAQATKVLDRSEYAVQTGNRDALQLALGAEYQLSKRTILWSSVGTIDNKNESRYAANAGNGPRGANFVPAGNPRATSASVGITHFF